MKSSVFSLLFIFTIEISLLAESLSNEDKVIESMLSDTVRASTSILNEINDELFSDDCLKDKEHLIKMQKLQCIKEKNQSFIDRHIQRIKKEISQLENNIKDFQSGVFKDLPFADWKLVEQQKIIELKNNKISELEKLSSQWFRMKNKDFISKTPLILNSDMMNILRSRLTSQSLSKLDLRGRLTNEISFIFAKDRKEGILHSILSKPKDNEEKEVDEKQRLEKEEAYKDAVDFVKSNSPSDTINNNPKTRDRGSRDFITSPNRRDPYLLVNRPKILDVILSDPTKLKELIQTDKLFKNSFEVQLDATRRSLDNSNSKNIVNPLLAQFYIDEVKELMSGEKIRSDKSKELQMNAINERTLLEMSKLESKIDNEIGTEGCLDHSINEISQGERDLNNEAVFFESDFYVFNRDKGNEDIAGKKSILKQYHDSLISQYKFEEEDYSRYARSSGDLSIKEFYILSMFNPNNVDLSEVVKKRPELKNYISDDSINLTFLFNTKPSSQGESNACLAHAISTDLAQGRIDGDGSISKGEQYFQNDLYEKLLKETGFTKDEGLPYSVFVDEINDIDIRTVGNKKVSIKSSTTSLYVPGENQDSNNVSMIPNIDFFKSMLKSGQGISVGVVTDTHSEHEDSIRLRPKENNKLGGHIFYLSGYEESSVDPYDGIEKPMFIVRDSYTSHPIEYRISAKQMILYLEGIGKIDPASM